MRLRRTFVVVVVLAIGVAIALPLATSRAGPAGGWTIVNAPSSGAGSDDLLLATTCANSQECFAVGVNLLSLNGGIPSPLIEGWDGTSWSLVSTPTPGAGSGFFGVTCVNGSDCWAVGALVDATGNPSGSLAEHWDGVAWRVIATPNLPGAYGAILHGVSCTSSSDCWAVGETTDNTGLGTGTLLLQWNGTSWTLATPAVTGQPFEQLNSVNCVAADNCWAVGFQGPQQQNSKFLPILPGAVGDQGLIEHFDGSQWTVVPSYAATPPNGAWLSSVDCLAADDCWVVGSTTDTSGGASGNLVQQWNGTSWSVVPAPQPPGGAGDLTDVTCLGPAQCWASGIIPSSAGSSNFQPAPEIEAWNGADWSIEPTPNVTALGLLTGITCVKADGCWSVGSAVTVINGMNPQFESLLEQLVLPPQSSQGFVAAAADGGVFNFGVATFHGSMGGHPLNKPVVGIAATPDGNGYWEVAADGGLFNFGDAGFDGSMGGHPLNKPVVGIVATPDGNGYWEVATDGGIFNFGDAGFYGSMGAMRLNQPIVGIAAAPDGKGYWEVAADGGIFAFGSAKFDGSMGGTHLVKPVVGMAATPNGKGYWEVAADGGVFTFGNAPYDGSVPGQGITAGSPVVGITATPDGGGYWEIGADGSTYAYGDAAFLGSLVGIPLAAPVVSASS